MRRGLFQLAAAVAVALFGSAALAQQPADTARPAGTAAAAEAAVPQAAPAAQAATAAPAARSDRPADTAAATPPATADRPVRIRASHRVDVIAPHERVETIIDRMRARGPATAVREAPKATDRAPARAPDSQRGPAHNAGDHGRAREVVRPAGNGSAPAERR